MLPKELSPLPIHLLIDDFSANGVTWPLLKISFARRDPSSHWWFCTGSKTPHAGWRRRRLGACREAQRWQNKVRTIMTWGCGVLRMEFGLVTVKSRAEPLLKISFARRDPSSHWWFCTGSKTPHAGWRRRGACREAQRWQNKVRTIMTCGCGVLQSHIIWARSIITQFADAYWFI
jgi:hypothetical protein